MGVVDFSLVVAGQGGEGNPVFGVFVGAEEGGDRLFEEGDGGGGMAGNVGGDDDLSPFWIG